MLLDAHALDAESVLQTDFCVVGSGMGGAAVAQALAHARRDVLIVEAGGVHTPNSTYQPLLYENAGRTFGLPVTRSIELGGSSEWWHGICSPLDEIDFEARSWIEGSGWPITRHQLDSFYRQATALLGLDEPYDVDGQSLPLECRSRLKDIEYSSLLVPKVFLVNEPALRWKGRLLELAHSGKLRCVFHAPALELVLNDAGNAVSELVVGAGSRTAIIRANVFIICAGALETPRLLLNSRQRRPAGIGNDTGLVGSNLLDHPMGHFSKLSFHRPTKAPLYASMGLTQTQPYFVGLTLDRVQQKTRGLANHCLWIRPSSTDARIDDQLLLSFLGVKKVRDLSIRQIFGILRNRDIQNRVLAKCVVGFQPSYIFGDLFFLTEQFPNPRSRVELSQKQRDRFDYPIASVNWQISNADIEGFDRYLQTVLKEGLVSGQYSLVRHDPISEWTRSMSSAAHHLGTAKMGTSPRSGVVDSDLQVFGVNNLFIGDGSVFPTAGNANPSLTIVALALRLAEHLINKSQTQSTM